MIYGAASFNGHWPQLLQCTANTSRHSRNTMEVGRLPTMSRTIGGLRAISRTGPIIRARQNAAPFCCRLVQANIKNREIPQSKFGNVIAPIPSISPERTVRLGLQLNKCSDCSNVEHGVAQCDPADKRSHIKPFALRCGAA